MTQEGTSRGDILVNAVRYPLYIDKDRGLAWWREDSDPDEPSEYGKPNMIVWRNGWADGMGGIWYDPNDPNRYAYTLNMDATEEGFVRLSTAHTSDDGNLTASPGNFVSIFEETVGSNRFIYFATANRIKKYYQTTTTITPVQQITVTNGAAGRATKFRGKWYQAWGASAVFKELTTPAPYLTQAWYYNGATYTDRSVDARNVTGNAFTLLSGATDYFYWGCATTWTRLGVDIQTAGAGATVSFQYSKGGGVWGNIVDTDGTSEFTVDGEITWTAPGDWATDTVNGVVDYWIRAVPSGAFGTAPTAIWAAPADTWTNADAGQFAIGFTTYQDGATAKIAKAYSTNLVALAATAPLTAGSWGSGFEVGDTTASITSLADTGVTLFVAKTDNLYYFDGSGNAAAIFNLSPGKGSSSNGVGLLAVHGQETALYNHIMGEYLVEGSKIGVIGPNTLDLQSIPGTSGEPYQMRHYAVAIAGEWIYLAGVYNAESQILAGRMLDGLRKIRWHTIIYDANQIAGMYIDSNRTLWTINDLNGIYGYQLGQDGSPDPGTTISIGRGSASTTHQFIMPAVKFNGVLQQLQRVTVETRGVGATCPVQVKCVRDGGSIENVGATVTGNGISKRYWTEGSNDTAQNEVRLVLDITTTAGYAPTSSDPQIHEVTLLTLPRPDVADIYHFIIDTTAYYSNGGELLDTPKKIRDALDTLKSGASVTCQDPDGNPYSLNITRVKDIKVEDEDGRMLYLFEVWARERVTS